MRVLLRYLLAGCVAATGLLAWNPPVDTAGPVTTRLQVPSSITSLDPFSGTLTIINDSSREIIGTFELRGIDGWSMAPAQAPFTAAAQSRVTVPFTVAPAGKSYSAL